MEARLVPGGLLWAIAFHSASRTAWPETGTAQGSSRRSCHRSRRGAFSELSLQGSSGLGGPLMTGALCARMLFATSLVAAVVMPLTAPGQMLPVPAPPPPAPTDQTPASPQTPAPAREAPGAIYQDAMHPLAV